MKKAYQYHHESHLFTGESEVHKISGYDNYILPALATWIAPTAHHEQTENAIFDVEKQAWKIEKKQIEVTAYHKETQESKTFDDVTLVTDEYTLTMPPSKYYTFNDKLDQWELTQEAEQLLIADARSTAKTNIDNKATLVYTKWTRFTEEYTAREAQALAFKKANYEGDCGDYITMFAVPAQVSNQEATDLILLQADQLRDLQRQLAAQRMRKNELDFCFSVDEIDTVTADILMKMTTLGAHEQ